MKYVALALAAIFSVGAGAQSKLAQDIPVRSNPRFLPHFLERFSDGFRAKTRFQPEMPESLRGYWRENMSEPRDFAEEIQPGIKWPRFQWGIETSPAIPPEPASTNAVYQWFDVKNPERLVREWNRAFCLDLEKNYIGVSWSGDLRRVEFFLREGVQLKVRQYEDKKFKREAILQLEPRDGRVTARAQDLVGKTIFSWTPVGRAAPRLPQAQAAYLQFSVEREFLISPRSYTKTIDGRERVFFP